MTGAIAKDIQAAAAFMAERGIYGVVWADANLIAERTFGPLVEFVPLGKPITESVLPLLGFDDQIMALVRRPRGSVVIPNVLPDSTERQGQRINISVYWMAAERRFLLLMSRAVSRTELEVELTAQVRARAIAEADVTAKSRIIAKANDELLRVNQNLQEFASVISHDLRSPLRRLRHYAGEAATSVEAGETKAVVAALEQVRQQAKRMGTMLTGLLEYSRIGRRIEAVETVDLRAMVEEIASSIERSEGIEIRIEGTWPTLETLAQPLDIVLRNLIDNAVKHHDRGEGSVAIHAEDGDESWIFSVHDDGPGIEPAWHGAIFEPFKRIGDEDTAPEGSGIGLALVKRTVEWCGGSVEVRSDPANARGTTFRVLWPKRIIA